MAQVSYRPYHPNRQSRQLFKTVFNLALLAGLIGAAAWGYQHRLQIEDWIALRAAPANPEAVATADRLQFSQQAKTIYLRTRPEIDDRASFLSHCPDSGELLELGCYIGGRNRIYLLRITNTELAAETDTVAAHEMLHAAWQRMSDRQRHDLEPTLEAQVTALHNANLNAVLAAYAKTEPGQRSNELHSLLGTEYSNLSPVLELYYRQFFLSRQPTLQAHQRFTAAFDLRKQKLTRDLATINSRERQLDDLDRRMAALKASGEIEQYNALVPTQNKLVVELRGLINDYNAAVEEYNALVKSLNNEPLQTVPGR